MDNAKLPAAMSIIISHRIMSVCFVIPHVMAVLDHLSTTVSHATTAIIIIATTASLPVLMAL